MVARTIGLALAVGCVGCASAPPSRSAALPSDWPRARVYVDTPDTGDAAERRARQQSVVDLREALARRHDRLAVVDSPTQADIAVTIVERVVADSKGSLSLIPPRYYPARNIVRLPAARREAPGVDAAPAGTDVMSGRVSGTTIRRSILLLNLARCSRRPS